MTDSTQPPPVVNATVANAVRLWWLAAGCWLVSAVVAALTGPGSGVRWLVTGVVAVLWVGLVLLLGRGANRARIVLALALCAMYRPAVAPFFRR